MHPFPQFSLYQYRLFLESLVEWNYEFHYFGDYDVPAHRPQAWIRHDVDYSWGRAFAMLCVENVMEPHIPATYFFRDHDLEARVYSAFSAQIEEEGWPTRLGYHYELFSRDESDQDVRRRILMRKQQFGFEVISAHGKPFYRDARAIPVCGKGHGSLYLNAYSVPASTNALYLTDTGRFRPQWNLYDRCFHIPLLTEEYQTWWFDDIMEVIYEKRPNLVVNFHPDRWSYSTTVRAVDWVKDNAKGWIKECIKLARSF